MNKIEVGVIAEHGNALETMGFLARLTQRGHNITCLQDIKDLLGKPVSNPFAEALMKMELHGTIKRFTPITIAIVGASRRFLAQARTNQVGFNYVSASLQYSDYSNSAKFTVPYELFDNSTARARYLQSCKFAMDAYADIIDSGCGNDTASERRRAFAIFLLCRVIMKLGCTS